MYAIEPEESERVYSMSQDSSSTFDQESEVES